MNPYYFLLVWLLSGLIGSIITYNVSKYYFLGWLEILFVLAGPVNLGLGLSLFLLNFGNKK